MDWNERVILLREHYEEELGVRDDVSAEGSFLARVQLAKLELLADLLREVRKGNKLLRDIKLDARKKR